MCSFDNLNDYHVIRIANLLKDYPNANLNSLYLADNNITDLGASVLAKALEYRKKLNCLKIANCHLTNDGIFMLLNHANCKIIDIQDNQVEINDQIIKVLESTHCQIEQCFVPFDQICKIITAINKRFEKRKQIQIRTTLAPIKHKLPVEIIKLVAKIASSVEEYS